MKPNALHDPVHEVLPPVLSDLPLQPVVEAPHQHLLNSLNVTLDQILGPEDGRFVSTDPDMREPPA